MLELRESETARALLRNTEVMQALKVSDWERYRRIEDLLARTYFDARDVRRRPSSFTLSCPPLQPLCDSRRAMNVVRHRRPRRMEMPPRSAGAANSRHVRRSYHSSWPFVV